MLKGQFEQISGTFLFREWNDVVRQREELPELRHLRYFITLAEELHFARAAERLQMEQSPLSRAIREMERLLGVRLFERNTRSTRITRAGKVLLEYAKRAVALLEQGRANARSAALGHSNQLRIGLSDCTAYGWMAEVFSRYRESRPEVSVWLSEMSLPQQISAIRDDLLDASISLDGAHRDGIEAEAVASDTVCAVVPSGHPFARANLISPADLTRHSLILFSTESDLGGGSRIDNFVGTLANPVIAFRANSLGIMLGLVALGHGIGLVGSAQMTGVNRRGIVLRPIGGAVPSLTTYLLHSDSGISEPLEAFIELARELASGADSTDVLS
ncbi:MAG: LysR family transcriptional regulator [Burkholderiales bacterium]|nr:LysR family transcriptional regulator [Burkholderiales bacterium]